MLIGVVLTAAVLWFSLVVLTALGERRRGGRVWLAATAGAFFPLAWIVWYLRDERPYDATSRVR